MTALCGFSCVGSVALHVTVPPWNSVFESSRMLFVYVCEREGILAEAALGFTTATQPPIGEPKL